jgi:hypothetical protein
MRRGVWLLARLAGSRRVPLDEHRRLTGPGMLLLAIVASALLAARAIASGPVISAGEAPVSISMGQTAVLAIKVADVQGLYGFDVQLKFDPSAAEAVDADPQKPGVQVLPGDFLSPDFVVRNVADNAAGTCQFAVTQLNPSEPKSGSGTLFSLSFLGVAADRTTPVEITSATLSTRDGEAIPVTLVNGEIRVGTAPSVPSASPTPLPSAAPPAPDIDALTAVPTPTLLPTFAQPATDTTVPTAPVPATTDAMSTAVVTATTAQAVVASVSATPRLTSTPVAQSAKEGPAETATATANVVAPTTTPARIARVTSEPIISGTPRQPAETPSTAAAPARSGLLVAGGILLALAVVALVALVVVRARARQP